MDQIDFENSKETKIYRIEKNRSETLFIYVRPYPNDKSSLFRPDKSALVFYFDDKYLNKHFLRPFLELAGKVAKIKTGSYFNNRGNSKKRVKVFFASVLFESPESVASLLNWEPMQRKINDSVEYKRQTELQLKYNPNFNDEDEQEESVDEEGFVTIRQNSFHLNSLERPIYEERFDGKTDDRRGREQD